MTTVELNMLTTAVARFIFILIGIFLMIFGKYLSENDNEMKNTGLILIAIGSCTGGTV